MFILSQGFFSFSCPASKKAGGAQKVGRGHPGELTQTGQRNTPYHIASCPVYKLGGAGWEGWIAAQELTGHRSASGEQLHCASLVWYSLILLVFLLSFYYYYYHYYYLLPFCPIKLSSSQPTNFTFFSDSLPHPTGWGEWASGCVMLSCRLGLNHDIIGDWKRKYLNCCTQHNALFASGWELEDWGEAGACCCCCPCHQWHRHSAWTEYARNRLKGVGSI